MPNYRLTHQMTGTTVPATAGYYGAHNQSLTKWKQAGAEMYQWKSDDFANAYFMGATFDTDAYKTVTISGAVDSAFNGAYVYSSTALKWLKGVAPATVYSIWKDGTTWKLTDGNTTYTAADNGLNTPPATFTRTLAYPLTITVVGAGIDNKVIVDDGGYVVETANGETAYGVGPTGLLNRYWGRVIESDRWISIHYMAFLDQWWISYFHTAGSGFNFYTVSSTDENPPKSGYVLGTQGDAPAPTLEYTLEAEAATLSVTSSAKFAATSLSGTWYPVNSGTGTPVYSEYTIAESWNTAESVAFNSLRAWLGGTEGTDCFRGYLPVNESGEYKFTNVWMLSSGGTGSAFDTDRTYGQAGAWCNFLTDIEVMGVFDNRTTAMHFAGAIIAKLKQSGNLYKTGNINWLRLRELPKQPEEKIINGKRYWVQDVQMDMLYLTESVYA